MRIGEWRQEACRDLVGREEAQGLGDPKRKEAEHEVSQRVWEALGGLWQVGLGLC